MDDDRGEFFIDDDVVNVRSFSTLLHHEIKEPVTKLVIYSTLDHDTIRFEQLDDIQHRNEAEAIANIFRSKKIHIVHIQRINTYLNAILNYLIRKDLIVELVINDYSPVSETLRNTYVFHSSWDVIKMLFDNVSHSSMTHLEIYGMTSGVIYGFDPEIMKLRTLILHGNVKVEDDIDVYIAMERNIYPGAIIEICNKLNVTQLNHLELVGLAITDSMIKDLPETLTTSQLQHLDITMNRISAKGLKRIIEVIPNTFLYDFTHNLQYRPLPKDYYTNPRLYANDFLEYHNSVDVLDDDTADVAFVALETNNIFDQVIDRILQKSFWLS